MNPDLDMRALAETAEVKARNGLAKGPGGLADLGASLHEVVDSEIRFLKAHDPLACREGCHWCCHRVVQATIPEVARAVAYIQTEFSDEQRVALRVRLDEYERVMAPTLGTGGDRLRPACPLLVDGRCSAYAARPAFCRAMNSFFAEKCREDTEHPERMVRIPMVSSRLDAAEAVMQGVSQAVSQRRAYSGVVDFGRALKRAIDEPQSFGNWLDGGLDFGYCETRIPPPERRPPASDAVPSAYPPGEEPTGFPNLAATLLPEFLLERGLAGEARQAARGRHPLMAILRANLTPSYRSVEEQQAARVRFAADIEALKTTAFDAREAFDGLLGYRPLWLSYQQQNNRDLAASMGEFICGVAAKAVPDLSWPIEAPRKPGPLRVGFLGRDLSWGSLSPWLWGWLQTAPSDVETHLFMLRDRSDRTTDLLRGLCTRFHTLTGGRSVPAEGRHIRNLDLDLLVFLDAETNMRTNQLASFRLARCQAACWGAVETTGLPTMDVFLSGDGMEPPEAQDHYTERLVRLPRAGVVYRPEPEGVSPLTRADLPVPAGPLIVNLQQSGKFAPEWDELYLRINEQTRQPIVFVNTPSLGSDLVRERFARLGVKAVWLPYLELTDYRRIMQLADVVLDPPGWNGGITTVHAIAHRAPIVTWPTGCKRGRQSACWLRMANGQGLIAESLDDLVALATDLDRVREGLSNLDPGAVFDDQLAAEAFWEFARGTLS